MNHFKEQSLKATERAPLLISIAGLILFLIELGMVRGAQSAVIFLPAYIVILNLLLLSYTARFIFIRSKFKRSTYLFDLVVIACLIILFAAGLMPGSGFRFGDSPFYISAYILLFGVLIRETASLQIRIRGGRLNPALLFILSFVFIIIIGSLLLLLPSATYSHISFMDALFTATSAVCVTGLTVVDTATFFTPTGQAIILILIQLGGLGIMTFTSFFAYFFQDSSSFKSQLMVKDITNADKMAEGFRMLKRVLVLTFMIEAAGALSIYFSVNPGLFPSTNSRIFFSVFHSVSSFCNAGFSTYSLGLYDPLLRFNYLLLIIISLLFITGGIGFPILFNYLKYLKHVLKNRWARYRSIRSFTYLPGVININTRIVISVTLILIITGTALMLLFEYNNTLREHPLAGKIVTAFFTATVPRTAGFNSIDFTALHFSTLMLVFFLMWVGGSPASTAGGIKTSTLALATLNIISIASGKKRVEAYKREISAYSMQRAFAIIALSLITIGFSVFLIASFDPEKTLLQIAFESFSAYSTVGLSLGVTPTLSEPSKLVIIATMFIGRVSMLTLLVAFLRKANNISYRYPSEEILIN